MNELVSVDVIANSLRVGPTAFEADDTLVDMPALATEELVAALLREYED